MQTDGQTDSMQTDRHDEADSRFPQFCECAYTLLMLYREKKSLFFARIVQNMQIHPADNIQKM
jgi:hypothetical protein